MTGVPGPPLEALTRRLAECPAEFLAAPRTRSGGSVHVPAVVADLLRDLGGPPPTTEQMAIFAPTDARRQRNWLALVLIACWLLHDEVFRQPQTLAAPAADFLARRLNELAQYAAAPSFVTDPDRREELARLALYALDMRPAGETQAQAEDRLLTLDSAERSRVVEAARAGEARAQAIREAMAKKAADEAAAQYSRE